MKSNIEIGRRKKAIAKAVWADGTGRIEVNGTPVSLAQPEMIKLMLMEPIVLAGETSTGIDIDVQVTGGGIVGQAEAARQAIALSLVKKSKKLEKVFMEYDRNMLVSDSRRTEPHKPGPSEPRHHKQRSKR